MAGLRARAESILNPDVELAHMGKKNDDIEEGEEAPMMSNGSPVSEPQQQKGLRSQIIDGACICLNIASTVLLVFLNKWYVVGRILSFHCLH